MERKKDLFRRAPAERAHREVIVLSVPNSELFLEVLKRIELVRSIEVFVIFSMAALDLTVVSGRKRLDEFMTNSKLSQRSFKQCFFIGALGVQTIGKLEAVVRLNAFDGIRKALYTMFDELRRGKGVVLLKCF